MNYFTTWEQRQSIRWIQYNVKLTTYAVGHPQPPICLTQKTFFQYIARYRFYSDIAEYGLCLAPIKYGTTHDNYLKKYENIFLLI